MKRRLVVPLVGLAISFALPTFAQQEETAKLHEIISKKYNEAINNHDAAAIAALYTEDAIFVDGSTGPLYGRQAIEKFYADLFKGWQPKNHTSTTDLHSGRMLGPDNLTRAGVWSETGKGKNGEDVPIKGYWSEIDTREGDAWKICVLTGTLPRTVGHSSTRVLDYHRLQRRPRPFQNVWPLVSLFIRKPWPKNPGGW
jgi:uncharacterized protein (TIGR02246 family)